MDANPPAVPKTTYSTTDAVSMFGLSRSIRVVVAVARAAVLLELVSAMVAAAEFDSDWMVWSAAKLASVVLAVDVHLLAWHGTVAFCPWRKIQCRPPGPARRSTLQTMRYSRGWTTRQSCMFVWASDIYNHCSQTDTAAPVRQFRNSCYMGKFLPICLGNVVMLHMCRTCKPRANTDPCKK